MVEDLTKAVALYEEHPSQVHAVESCPDLLVVIRAGRSLCTTLGRPDADFAALEMRAQTLRHPLH